jgi:Undecaprenyl-phosphate galactose phosphotransferase WbaP
MNDNPEITAQLCAGGGTIATVRNVSARWSSLRQFIPPCTIGLADVVAATVAAYIATWLPPVTAAYGMAGAAGQLHPESTVDAVLLTVGSAIAWFLASGHYRYPFKVPHEALQVAAGFGFGLVIANVAVVGVRHNAMPLSALVTGAMLPPMSLICRAAARRLLALSRAGVMRTAIIGSEASAALITKALRANNEVRHDVVAILAADDFAPSARGTVVDALRFHHAAFAVVALGGSDPAFERSAILDLDRARVPYAVVPYCRTLPVAGLEQEFAFGHDVLFMRPPARRSRSPGRVAKLMFDMAAAAALVMFLAPVMLTIALLVRRDGGPAIFGHQRIGAGGRPFRCLKFRTMIINADRVLWDLLATDPAAAAEWAAAQKLRNDPRVTAVGRFLRITSLDELPQLFNILAGDMSLVGPRPIVEAEAARYAADIAYYSEVRPGVTGLWQVSGRSETTYEHRVALDVWYVRNWSFMRDIVILFKTIPAVLMRRGSA